MEKTDCKNKANIHLSTNVDMFSLASSQINQRNAVSQRASFARFAYIVQSVTYNILFTKASEQFGLEVRQNTSVLLQFDTNVILVD